MEEILIININIYLQDKLENKKKLEIEKEVLKQKKINWIHLLNNLLYHIYFYLMRIKINSLKFYIKMNNLIKVILNYFTYKH